MQKSFIILIALIGFSAAAASRRFPFDPVMGK
jgi:hypothetical protein